MKFVPERLEVAAGDTIVWTNRDFVPHSVTAPGVESGDLGEGVRWSFTPRKKGEIAYICRLHPLMRGVVLVR